MQTLQNQIGFPPHVMGRSAGKQIELAPGLTFTGLVMAFERNEEIFVEEEAADYVYRVISGAVRDVRILSDGRRQIGAFHLPGEVFGLECGAEHTYSAEAVVDSEIALVRRSVLERAAADDSQCGRRLWDLTSRDLRRLQNHMLLLGRKNASARVVAFLLDMASRGPGDGAVDLPMSRSDIGDFLGLTIETVSRTMTTLVRDRSISMTTSRRIVLNDRLASSGL